MSFNNPKPSFFFVCVSESHDSIDGDDNKPNYSKVMVESCITKICGNNNQKKKLIIIVIVMIRLKVIKVRGHQMDRFW